MALLGTPRAPTYIQVHLDSYPSVSDVLIVCHFCLHSNCLISLGIAGLPRSDSDRVPLPHICCCRQTLGCPGLSEGPPVCLNVLACVVWASR